MTAPRLPHVLRSTGVPSIPSLTNSQERKMRDRAARNGMTASRPSQTERSAVCESAHAPTVPGARREAAPASEEFFGVKRRKR